VILGNMRQRGGIVLAIILLGTPISLAIWLTWSPVVALCVYAGAILSVLALLLLSINQTPPCSGDRDAQEGDSDP
jgi:hypothetical protein